MQTDHRHRSSRCADAAPLARQLRDSRADTLATFAAYQQALPELTVPQRAELNPPLWELGHVGWFQEYWITRNGQRALGCHANPDIERPPGVRSGADQLYHSSRVAHDTRWSLPLPHAADTCADLRTQLAHTLALLADTPNSHTDLYFFRLALAHEDMHHEAALIMAQSLGLPIRDPRWQTPRLPQAIAHTLQVPATRWQLGTPTDTAHFCFDNELGECEQTLAPYDIDSTVVSWAQFLDFVEAGGYSQSQWWSADGQRWLTSSAAHCPRYLRREGGQWQQWRHGQWTVLPLDGPACHLTYYEAQAWCHWRGRCLPTEAQWECALAHHPKAFDWGQVWEWTASAFAPFEGFRPHPYRDYSLPWFDGRPVLRGASFATSERLRHWRFRNHYTADRNDIFAGFRSCAP